MSRVINDEKLVKIRNDLQDVNWADVASATEPNEAYRLFMVKFKHAIDMHCPLSKSKVSNCAKDKPWLTKGIIKSCRRKNRLYYKFVNCRTLENERKYKMYKNKLLAIIKRSEKMYYNQLLLSHKDNIKSTWKVLNDIIGKGNSVSSRPTYFVDELNRKIENVKDVADGFNNFFVNIGPNLAKSIGKCKMKRGVLDYMGAKVQESLFLSPVSENEVLNIVSELKSKASRDINDLSMVLVKSVIQDVVKPVTNICNLSLTTGIFPDDMKCAKVIPLFKTGCNRSFTNYRPISLLPQLSKVLEKVFCKRLVTFLNKHKVFSESQFGFRHGRSTADALASLVESITDAFDKKMFTIGVFVDLRKAFDTVNHDILMQKVEHCGVRGVALSWLRSYLSNRTQCVYHENTLSDVKKIHCGVPQGSVLGPVLFLLYVNDIENVSKVLKCILFADDTTFVCSDSDINILCDKLNIELSNLNEWFNVNKLSLNIDKTNFILFTNSDTKVNCKLVINGVSVKRVFNTKFLGVVIDSKLNWKAQINSVSTKMSKSVSVIYKAGSILGKNTLKCLYNSLVVPYMYYCSEVWGFAYKSSSKRICVLQRKAIRTVCKISKNTDLDIYFRGLNTLPFLDIVKVKVCSMMYRAVNKQLCHSLQSRIFVNSVAKRNNRMLKIVYCRTTLKSHCISVVGPKLFNSIPEFIQKATTYKSFTNQIKRYFLNTIC